MTSFLLKLFFALGLLLIAYVAYGGGSLWTVVGVELVILGALIAAHLLGARLSRDDNVWEPMSARSIELPMAREDAALHVHRVLAARHDTSIIAREGTRSHAGSRRTTRRAAAGTSRPASATVAPAAPR